jgi:hypothetical protein
VPGHALFAGRPSLGMGLMELQVLLLLLLLRKSLSVDANSFFCQ